MLHKEQKNLLVGRIGEKIAIKYFIDNGYFIIAKNARISHKEIDLIIQKGINIYFIEVKTKLQTRKNNHIKAEDYLSRQKIKHLRQALEKYCLILAKKEENIKLGLMAITLQNNKMANIRYFMSII